MSAVPATSTVPLTPEVPSADRAGNPAAADRVARRVGRRVGRGTATHSPPGAGTAAAGRVTTPARRWQLALVTVAAGIALGISAGLVVAVALRVAPGTSTGASGAVPAPAGRPVPSGGMIPPTVAGLWTSSRPMDSARPPVDAPSVAGEGMSSMQPAGVPSPPAAEPVAPAPNAANVPNAANIDRTSPRQPATSIQPEPTQAPAPAPATTSPAQSPPRPSPTPPEATQTSAPPPVATTPAQPPPTTASSAPTTSAPRSPSATTSKPAATTMQPVSTQSVPPSATGSNVTRSAEPRPRPRRIAPLAPSPRRTGTHHGVKIAKDTIGTQDVRNGVTRCPPRGQPPSGRDTEWLLRILEIEMPRGAGWRSDVHRPAVQMSTVQMSTVNMRSVLMCAATARFSEFLQATGTAAGAGTTGCYSQIVRYRNERVITSAGSCTDFSI